jgi:CubicO group peptidase (beta-lactamase class C family)
MTLLRIKSQASKRLFLNNSICFTYSTDKWSYGGKMNKNIANLEHMVRTAYRNIAGIVVLKNGERVYEGYFDGYTSEDTLHMTSVTKSVVSALIGIAIEQGSIQSVDQKVLEFFPDYRIKRGEKTIQAVTLRNLLTMTAPYKYRSEPYTRVYTSADWTRAALDLLGGRAGITGKFKYSTVGTQILSGILMNASGQSMLDFAGEHLFKPLSIQVPQPKRLPSRNEHFAFIKGRRASGWVVDPQGVNTAGWGLCLAPRDMAKIGQLYLNGGEVGVERIVSTKWIADSTTQKSRWGKLPYGYLWWILNIKGSHGFAALGDGGNAIFVVPKMGVVVAIASRFMPRPKNRIKLITEHILPLFK